MEKRPAHPPLNDRELVVAAIGGFGLLLLLIAGLMAGFGTVEDNTVLNSLLWMGFIMIAISFGLWLIMLTPWKHFDDLQTPFYTGHHHDDDDEHHAEAVEAEIVAATATPTETILVVETHEAEPRTPSAPDTTPPAETGAAPTIAQAATEPDYIDDGKLAIPDVPDDLKMIEGIGPKTEEALNNEGITTFAQLAMLTPEEIEYMVKEKQGVRLVGNAETWSMQAEVAARGDLEALLQLQERIKGGKEYDYLMRIEGIGPQIQKVLHEADIRTFKQLALVSLEALQRHLRDANITADPTTWARQAQLIIDGDIDGLKAYQDQLKGGRE